MEHEVTVGTYRQQVLFRLRHVFLAHKTKRENVMDMDATFSNASSSLAPGASDSRSITSPTRES